MPDPSQAAGGLLMAQGHMRKCCLCLQRVSSQAVLGPPLGACWGHGVVTFWCVLRGFLHAETLPYRKDLVTAEPSPRRGVPYGNPCAAADNKRGAF